MWRTELWHVLFLHFPIAVLLLSTIAALLRAVVKLPAGQLFLTQLVAVLLILGVGAAWLAILTGEQAYNVVVRTICDPPVLQAHQWWSYASTIAYSVALAVLAAQKWLPGAMKRVTPLLTVLLMLAGAGALLYAGHLGASVVYQQGGGTYKPSADCAEFAQ